MIDRARYGRQMLLAEIGEEGQRRLGRAIPALGGSGLAYEIASGYALGAGMGPIVPGLIDEAALCPSFVRTVEARAVLSGSRAALAAVRRALAVTEEAGAPGKMPA